MNILLTGKYNSGKTTLLNRLVKDLNLTWSGYTSFTIEKDNDVVGFKMAPMDQVDTPFTIGIKDTPFTCKPYGDAFDTKGVEVLKRSMENEKSIIMMDELGFLESQSLLFQQAVFDCFNADQMVVGILKGRQTPFLNTIRARDDILFFNITEINRDQMYDEISNLIREGINA